MRNAMISRKCYV